MGEKRVALGEEQFASFGELDVSAAAFEEGDADLGFEAFDRLAQRGLGDVELLCGASEVELFGDGDEVADLSKGEIETIMVL